MTVPIGGTLPITVVVKNQGFANAAGSTVKLSLVVTPGTAAPVKTLLDIPGGARRRPERPADGAARPRPSRQGTPAGTYVVQACVDTVKLVAETSDENNCGTSVDTIKVQ